MGLGLNLRRLLAAWRIACLALLLLAGVPLPAQINGWTNTSAGKWEVGANWSLGTPPGTGDVFDNIFTGSTITIDATTSGSFPNTMTVNYVAVAAPTATLELDNAGTNVPLHILLNLDVTGDSALAITNSALQVDGVLTAGYLSSVAGNIELDSGWAQFGSVTLGESGYGNLYVNGGTLMVLGGMTLGSMPGGAGYVGVNGGTLIQTNAPIVLGGEGYGGFDVYGGSVRALGFQLGNAAGSQGFLNVVTGAVSVSSNLLVGNNLVTNPCGVTVQANGSLIVTNATGTAYIAVAQIGSLTLNGGLLQTDSLINTNGGTCNVTNGQLIITQAAQVENGSTYSVSSGTVSFGSDFTLGAAAGSTGAVLVADGGTLSVTNGELGIGNDGTLTNGAGIGSVTVSNATLPAMTINIGSTAGGLGSLTLQSNALVTVNANLGVVSGSLTVTSTVTLLGGTLSLTNGTARIGSAGNGRLTIFGGSHTIRQLILGSTNGFGTGSLFGFGGHLTTLSVIVNQVVVSGIDLDGSGGTIIIGDGHDAQMTVTAGTVTNFLAMYVGYTPTYTGAYAQSGGLTQVTNSLVVGDCISVNGAQGTVSLSGGVMTVTNATHSAVLDVRNGTFTLSPGATLVVDQLVVTNACGHFINNGGVLITHAPSILDPNMDADGDGQSNGNELLAGTDPLDPNSFFHLVSVTHTNAHDLRLDWSTVGGHSYVVQRATNGLGGPASFVDLSPVITVPGTSPGTTNYVQPGAATNPPAYYRVRLGP